MRTRQSSSRQEESKALRFVRRRVKFFVVRLSVCVLLAACLFGARYVNPKSAAMVNKYLTYTVDFTQPVESVMGYFNLKPQTIITPPSAPPAGAGPPAENLQDPESTGAGQENPDQQTPPQSQSPQGVPEGQNQA